jgi:hypothetical protein
MNSVKRLPHILALLIYLPAIQAGPLEQSVTVSRGERAKIDLLLPCKAMSILCDGASIEISAHPVEGVLFEIDKSAKIDYQHGGASIEPDNFSYLVSAVGHAEKIEVPVSIVVTPPDSRVQIFSPIPGATISGSTVTVDYYIAGNGHDHAHIQLNGEGHISIHDGSGSYQFTKVKPGAHRVTISLVNSNHKQLAGSGTRSSVNFILE